MRNLHFWFAAGLGILLVGFALTVLRTAVAESLWLDELHTSWSVSGSWQEIASRAAAGNQTPLYFWQVAVLTRTLGQFDGQQSEWILRLPSAIAWLLAIGIVARLVQSKVVPNDSRSWLFAIGIAGWVVLDRLQWFFASEARPYALVQLVTLAGWVCVENLVRADCPCGDKDTTMAHRKLKTWHLIVAWSLLAIANIYLHLTAVLPIVFQWLTAVGLTWWKRLQLCRNRRCALKLNVDAHLNEELRSGQWSQATSTRAKFFQTTWIFAAVGVGVATLPILQLAFPVWQRRGQWAAFASDVSLYHALTMFPFGPVLVIVFVVWMVDRLWHLLSRVTIASQVVATEIRCLWWIAMLGPWLSAWGLTAFGIAPMFHQRFVFASCMPLFIVGAIELSRCRLWSMRFAAVLAVAMAIPISQGSLSIWRAGYLVGSLRGEDWRAATRWVREQYVHGEPILCSSGLIEANSNSTSRQSLPLDSSFAEYLSFPLLGIYQLPQASSQNASVTPMLGDHRQWASQVVERLSEGQTRPDRMWLFYRGAPGRLKAKLTEFRADLKGSSIEIEAAEPVRFGNVHVVQLDL